MKWDELSREPCSVARSVAVIGDRWTLLILRDCFLKVRRFEDFQVRLGVSRAILADRLEKLTRNRVLAKVAYQQRPVRYEYRLTDKGRDLWKVLTALREWGDRWDTNGLGAPTIELVDAASGRPLVLALVDQETGQPVPRGRARLRPGPAADANVRKLLGGSRP